MEAFVIVFVVKMTFLVDNFTDNILVQFGGMPHWYETLQDCEASLKEYGSEHIIEEFISQTNDNETEYEIVLEPAGEAHCTTFDVESRNYPEYPEFDNMLNEEEMLGPEKPGLRVTL